MPSARVQAGGGGNGGAGGGGSGRFKRALLRNLILGLRKGGVASGEMGFHERKSAIKRAADAALAAARGPAPVLEPVAGGGARAGAAAAPFAAVAVAEEDDLQEDREEEPDPPAAAADQAGEQHHGGHHKGVRRRRRRRRWRREGHGEEEGERAERDRAGRESSRHVRVAGGNPRLCRVSESSGRCNAASCEDSPRTKTQKLR
ncbi:hypothetical protein OsJ_08677 [Oryza sativa Japonica Group]|uniref:Uncharacterized protein n=1 Tax=Oryza sativa subsp. japonica TaxID=39947 RepID=A3AC60_ORYSJ|nr:hypothetical protein OsJ_08677 [Oryza sativa Japonica Group]